MYTTRCETACLQYLAGMPTAERIGWTVVVIAAGIVACIFIHKYFVDLTETNVKEEYEKTLSYQLEELQKAKDQFIKIAFVDRFIYPIIKLIDRICQRFHSR